MGFGVRSSLDARSNDETLQTSSTLGPIDFVSEAGFHCYIEHQRTPSVGCQKLVYSGVECTLLPGSERADVAEESKTCRNCGAVFAWFLRL